VRGRQAIQGAFLIDINATVFGVPRALFPALDAKVFGGGAVTVGLLYAAPGAGALVGALTTGWISRVRRQGRAVIIAVVAWGLAVAAFGLAAWLPGPWTHSKHGGSPREGRIDACSGRHIAKEWADNVGPPLGGLESHLHTRGTFADRRSPAGHPVNIRQRLMGRWSFEHGNGYPGAHGAGGPGVSLGAPGIDEMTLRARAAEGRSSEKD
jgi:hypothetical protein